MRRTVLIGLLLMAIGCKNKNGSSASGIVPHSCSYTVFDQHGSIAANVAGGGSQQSQDVAINSNPTNFYDRINVHLCKFADCDTLIPAQNCASLPFGSVTPCSRTLPNQNVTFGPRLARFVNAGTGPNGAGYTTFNIHEEVCN